MALTYTLQAENGRTMAGEGIQFATAAEARKQLASIVAQQTGLQGRRAEFDDEARVAFFYGRQFVDRLWIEDSAGRRVVLDPKYDD